MAKTDLIVSDIHGYYDLVKKILTLPDFGASRVVFLGDYIDRGPSSLAVLKFVMGLVKSGKAMAIKGDHEDLFLKYLSGDESDQQLYLYNDGASTLKDMLGSDYDPQNVPNNQALIKEKYADIITFLQGLPYYYQDDHRLYVHGGIYPEGLNETSNMDKMWLREDYWFQQHNWSYSHALKWLNRKDTPNFGHNPVDKTIVTGHTITTMIYGKIPKNKGEIIEYGDHEAKAVSVEYTNEYPRIFIDGGSYLYHNLNVLKLSEDGRTKSVYQLSHENK